MPKISTETGVYRIMCTVTRVVYIGKASNIRTRVSGHLSLLRKGTHPNLKLQEDWNLHGESSFVIKVLKVVAWKNLDRIEKQVIQTYVDQGIPVYNGQDIYPLLGGI